MGVGNFLWKTTVNRLNLNEPEVCDELGEEINAWEYAWGRKCPLGVGCDHIKECQSKCRRAVSGQLHFLERTCSLVLMLIRFMTRTIHLATILCLSWFILAYLVQRRNELYADMYFDVSQFVDVARMYFLELPEKHEKYRIIMDSWKTNTETISSFVLSVLPNLTGRTWEVLQEKYFTETWNRNMSMFGGRIGGLLVSLYEKYELVFKVFGNMFDGIWRK